MPQLKKSLIALLLTSQLIGVAQDSNVGEQVHFTTEISEDASPAVLARVLLSDDKPISKITFEKGTYYFYPDKAYEVYSNISNHDDVIIYTAFQKYKFSARSFNKILKPGTATGTMVNHQI